MAGVGLFSIGWLPSSPNSHFTQISSFLRLATRMGELVRSMKSNTDPRHKRQSLEDSQINHHDFDLLVIRMKWN
jgi:hypothetical protein